MPLTISPGSPSAQAASRRGSPEPTVSTTSPRASRVTGKSRQASGDEIGGGPLAAGDGDDVQEGADLLVEGGGAKDPADIAVRRRSATGTMNFILDPQQDHRLPRFALVPANGSLLFYTEIIRNYLTAAREK